MTTFQGRTVEDEFIPDVFTSGPDPDLAPAAGGGYSDYDSLYFGFTAAAINLRVYDADLYIAFENPDTQSDLIRVRPGDSPFTIGGEPPIKARQLWVKTADDASAQASYELLAYR